jgi:hypothetical protein
VEEGRTENRHKTISTHGIIKKLTAEKSINPAGREDTCNHPPIPEWLGQLIVA